MSSPCAAPISADSFLIVYERYVYEFDTRVAGPTNSSGWKNETTWPQLQVWRDAWPGCAVVGNKFIVAGGEDKNGNSLKSTEIIDLRTRNITAGGGMEKPRGMFNLLSISGTLYALGGLHHDGKRNFSANDGGFFTTHTLITLVVSIMMEVFFDHLYSHLFVEIYEALPIEYQVQTSSMTSMTRKVNLRPTWQMSRSLLRKQEPGSRQQVCLVGDPNTEVSPSTWILFVAEMEWNSYNL